MHNLSEFDSKGLAAALAACREGMDAGQAPFGAAIGLNETLIAIAYNTGSRDHDPTAHAEVNAIRRACSTLSTTKLDGATLFSSCEPCPMCFSAAVFAGIR
ncbi:MAG: nucleoside deaminase, partial [Planctomycetota bacterium]